MKKIICDRCGKEIESVMLADKLIKGINYDLTSQVAFNVRKYDLCDDCQNDLTDWLNNGREEKK
jgi:hypothetical protein